MNESMEKYLKNNKLDKIRDDVNWSITIWSYIEGYYKICETHPTTETLRIFVEETSYIMPEMIKFQSKSGTEQFKEKLVNYMVDEIVQKNLQALRKSGKIEY